MRVPSLVAHVVGARPNYMKVAPVYAALEAYEGIEQRLVHTGQHYDPSLKDVFFDELPLPRPHHELHVGSGERAEQIARGIEGLHAWFAELRPALVVVAGDVNSTLAGAVAASLEGIDVCHLESGLRSFDKTMPEEHNRRATDHLSSLLLTHSESANDNLVAEGIPLAGFVAFVGNTMVDTLLANVDEARALETWRECGVEPGQYVLATLHRPGLVDDPERLAETVDALGRLAADLPVVFPVHPRTRARLEAGIATPAGVKLLPPLPYRPFLSLQADAAAVLTDSGGVQEETTALGVPCFTLRDATERPVTVTHGTNTILGLRPEAILEIPARLAGPRREGMPPLWDGRAGERAAAEIARLLAG